MKRLALGLAAVGLMVAGCSTETSDVVVEVRAKHSCEDAVKAQLKSPSTAKFEYATVNGSRTSELLVVGSVDSQNGFGATVRARFTCAATWSESADAITSAEVLMLNQLG